MKRTLLFSLLVLMGAVLFLPGCRERTVYTGPGDWLLLTEDPDDGSVAYNGHLLYVDNDFSDGALEFKIETYASIPDAERDVQFAVYFDTDRDATTGLSSAAGWGDDATPNDIGADFMMFVGSDTSDAGLVNENQIYTWDTTLPVPGWTEVGQAGSLYQPSGGDSVKGSVTEALLGDPSGQIYVVAILFCAPTDLTSFYYDHVPNSGHATLDLDSGVVVQSASQIANIVVPHVTDKRISLVTGKELTFEEAR